jgi:hypothetical protein
MVTQSKAQKYSWNQMSSCVLFGTQFMATESWFLENIMQQQYKLGELWLSDNSYIK